MKEPGRQWNTKVETVHNAPTAARNTIVSVAKKVEDNILRMMTVHQLSHAKHRHPPCRRP